MLYRDEHRADNSTDVASSLSSLKEIVSIVMGLALTNSILVLITRGHYTNVTSLSALPLQSALYTLVLVANIIRFYHGNVRHVDVLYGASAREDAGGIHGSLGSLGIDFFAVFVESVLFAVMSFYVNHGSDFLLLFMVLLVFDLAWNILTQQETNGAKDVSHQRRWMLNNVGGVLAVVILYMAYQSHHHALWLHLGVGAVALNTAIDFAVSWAFYFPSFVEDPIGA